MYGLGLSFRIMNSETQVVATREALAKMRGVHEIQRAPVVSKIVDSNNGLVAASKFLLMARHYLETGQPVSIGGICPPDRDQPFMPFSCVWRGQIECI